MKLSNIQPLSGRLDIRPVLLIVLSFVGLCTSLLGANLQGLDGSFKALTLAGNDILGVTSADAIARSTDGGVSFSELRIADDPLQAIAVDGDIAMAGGDLGRVLRADFSVDATAWTEVTSAATFGTVQGIASDGSNNWLAVTDESGDVLRSTDNGQTWALVANAPASALQAVAYDSVSGNWIAVGADFIDGTAYYSSDGTTWQSATGLSGGPLVSLAVDSAGTVVAVGEGVIFRSTDGGVSYSAVGNAPSESLNSVTAVAEGVFVAVGFEGLLVEIVGSAATITRHSDSEASTIEAVVAIAGAALVSGEMVVSPSSIDPNGGDFLESVSVTLTVPADTQVYYTVDGSIPSDQSSLYTAPFDLEESATLRVVAVDGQISSAVVSAEFVITPLPDATPTPKITVVDSARFLIEIPTSIAGQGYQLQSSTNLVNWDPVQSVRAGSGGKMTWTVSLTGTHRFFRILIVDEVPAPVQLAVADSSNLSITIPESQAGSSYQLQSSTDLVNWDPLQTVQVSSGEALMWTVPIDSTRRFYRVLISD